MFICWYLLPCIIIAFLGRHRRFGFWGYLFCSLLFTPVVGIIVLLAAIPVKTRNLQDHC